MGRVAGPLLVFFVFIYSVQCHLNQLVGAEDVELLNPKGLRTYIQGWNLQNTDSTDKLRPKSARVSRALPHNGLLSKARPSRNRRRTRRQAFAAKNGNTVEEPFSWNHRFTIEENHPTSLTKESAYSWQENTKRLKYTLEKDAVFQFLNPTGLRISIPANNVNMRFVDFRVKLNDEFRGNDGGHFPVNSYKRNGLWTYDIPQLRVKQGDTVYYWMRLSMSKEAFDVIVKGVLDITMGNPHSGGPHTDQIPFRPTTTGLDLASQPLDRFGGGPSATQASGTRGPFVWNHQFTINATYSDTFTRDSANNWLQHAEFLKRFLQKHIDFQFLNPTGLIISIPDDNINIVDFRIKLNEEFRENDGGHIAPNRYKRGGLWNYDIPQLQVKQGDKIYYWMRVKRGQEGFDAIVRGVLEITQGNPHTESTFARPASTQYNHLQTSLVIDPYRPVGGGQLPTGGGLLPSGDGQLPSGSGQSPIANGQSTIGGNQQPIGAVQVPFEGQQGDKGGQAFSWDHKFVSVNLNTTSNEFSASLPNNLDEYLKKSLERNIKFQFVNPSGLRILITGDDNNFRILDFNLKLNEEFKNLDPGHFTANVTRLRDGKWSYFYPNLKLKEGDSVYYWFRVVYGKDMWLYVVKGELDITQGDPHKGSNPIHTTTAPPRPPTYVVDTKPTVGGGTGGQAVRWEHKFTINTTNDGPPKKSANNWLQEAQLLKNTLEKDMDFKFLNPSGLRLSFSGDDNNFRILAFNIKLNEEFRTLGSGDYVANITKSRDGRWNYYYPNLKVKQGDNVYYWMRVVLGKDMNDYIVRGQLTLRQGDPHVGGPVPDVPPPVIWTQTQPSPTAASVPSSEYQPQAQTPNKIVPVQSQSNNQSPNQVPLAQNPAPANNPSQFTQTEILNRWDENQNQNPQKADPLPLVNSQYSPTYSSPTPTPVTSSTPQARPCVPQSGGSTGGSVQCPGGVVVDYRVVDKDGFETHQVSIGGKHPVHISVQVDKDKGYSDSVSGKS